MNPATPLDCRAFRPGSARRHCLPWRTLPAVATLALLGACQVDSLAPRGRVPDPSSAKQAGESSQPAALHAVMAGNAQSIAMGPALVQPGAPLAPFVEARLHAMTNVAMHDALNAIAPRYQRYLLAGTAPAGANQAAAALTAARDVIVAVAPAGAGPTNTWYAAEMAALAGTPGVSEGVTVGQQAAAAIVAARAADGTANGATGPYTPGKNPGDYQFTFPFNTPGFDVFGTGGLADANLWGATVLPFVVRSSSQFRVGRPYGVPSNAQAVRTGLYANDFNEVQRLGCATCAARTAEQTEIAQFWVENSPAGWNRIARTLVAQNGLTAHQAARAFALLQLTEFDTYLTTLESKYYYNFVRPVSAIDSGARFDGNPRTEVTPGWQVLTFPTPPVPDYPSAHASAGGGAWAVLDRVLPNGRQRFSTTSASLPGVTRTYASIEDAAWENADSRIYVGYHFRHATRVGVRQGLEVGRYIEANALRPLRK